MLLLTEDGIIAARRRLGAQLPLLSVRKMEHMQPQANRVVSRTWDMK